LSETWTATDGYRKAVHDVYASAALEPDPTLCCVDGVQWTLPGLDVPPIMLEMNYGCGSSVHPADLAGARPVLYVGVGGGLEALQLAYFRRFPGGVVAVDPVAEMRAAARRNLELAERTNPWFRSEFVRIEDGTAAELPVADGAVELVAQNCLFNVFVQDDLRAALAEVRRALAPGGRFATSDPIATRPIPEALRRDDTLRARCCSGCRTYDEYLGELAAAGLGRIVVRARRPYRMLLPHDYPELDRPLLLESLDLVAHRADAAGPPQVFTGRTAMLLGHQALSVHGALFVPGMPLPVSDAVAAELEARADFSVTNATYHASGPGCC
jgi:SAM-dependent methyltransferase